MVTVKDVLAVATFTLAIVVCVLIINDHVHLFTLFGEHIAVVK